jgi:hypothetical protein
VTISDGNNKRLTVDHAVALSQQHTRQASIRKDKLNTGGFFMPANGGPEA